MPRSEKKGDWSSRWSGRIGLKTDELQGSRLPQPEQETFGIPTRGHVDSTPEPTHLKLEFRREPFPEAGTVVRAAQKVVDCFPLVSGDDEAAFVQEAVQMGKPQQPSHTHTHTAQREEPPANTDWEAVKDANGDTYYWNKTTNVVRRRAPGVGEGKLVRPGAPSWKDAVTFTLTLDVDFATIGDHEGFKQGILWDVADAAKVDVKYVKIQGLRAGSVIVDLLIAPEVGEPHKVLQDLREQARSPGSRLLTGKLTSKTKGLATPAQIPASSSVLAKPEFKDPPIWHSSPAERAEEKQKQRAKEVSCSPLSCWRLRPSPTDARASHLSETDARASHLMFSMVADAGGKNVPEWLPKYQKLRCCSIRYSLDIEGVLPIFMCYNAYVKEFYEHVSVCAGSVDSGCRLLPLCRGADACRCPLTKSAF